VVIVSVTRDDLRDEFAMADEAFALSPISARAAQPSEEDYDAISQAFMETSRGRWFLGEYAKRNRNADTRMVLDAVARIEETLAAQKTPPPDPRLPEALAGIRAALAEARTVAAAALGDLALEENLAPVRKGARVIREIAWRLREIGADGRICDLIDSQVGAIEAACGKMAVIDPATDLSDAFGLIEGRIAAFDDGEAVAPAEAAVRSSPQAAEETPTSARAAQQEAVAQTPQPASVADEAEAATSDAAVPAELIDATVEAAEVVPEPADTFDAQDEAMLDMVALEMAAPDSDEAYEPLEQESSEQESSEQESYEREAAEDVPAAEPLAVAEQPAPIAAHVQPTSQAVAPLLEPSLGSSLIANGIVQRPRVSRPDPLAPIRRMSQTEKIALFS
jgi:chemotaxis protein histidine kinase CheA